MDSSAIISEFWTIVSQEGVYEGLRLLNARTPHRYTAIYRYDGDMLRNVYLFDQFTPSLRTGDDVRLEDAYCAIVGQRHTSVEFSDVHSDDAIDVKPASTVISYCGALITDDRGEPFGTLCHFDIKPCQARASDTPILEAIAPLIFKALHADATASPGPA